MSLTLPFSRTKAERPTLIFLQRLNLRFQDIDSLTPSQAASQLDQVGGSQDTVMVQDPNQQELAAVPSIQQTSHSLLKAMSELDTEEIGFSKVNVSDDS